MGTTVADEDDAYSKAVVASAKADVAATATPWGMKGVGTCMAATVTKTKSVKATCVKDKITIAEYTDAACKETNATPELAVKELTATTQLKTDLLKGALKGSKVGGVDLPADA